MGQMTVAEKDLWMMDELSIKKWMYDFPELSDNPAALRMYACIYANEASRIDEYESCIKRLAYRNCISLREARGLINHLWSKAFIKPVLIFRNGMIYFQWITNKDKVNGTFI